uniref:SAM domain-containing protein n=1 Tax=Panagrellus redivivus TaxID=6233 RepID=A0A7E5A0J9_PANRE
MTQLCGVASHAAPSSSTASAAALIDSDVAFLRDILELPMPDGATSHSIMSSPPTLPGPKRSRVLAMSRKSTSSSSSASSTHPTSPLGAASTSPPNVSYMNPMPQTTMTSYPGMKDVPAWLKLLRLHKYTQMFMRLSYDEMMALDEDRLEQLGVTKGARKKILQSVRKLYDRTKELGMLVKEMNGSCPNLRQTIHDLRMILSTPIVAYRPRLSEPDAFVEGVDPSVQLSEINPNNLPGHLSNVAARLHERIVVQKRFIDVDDESVAKLLQVYDRIASHEAFTQRQAGSAHNWRKALRALAMERGMNGGHGGHHYIKRAPTSGSASNGFSAGLHRYGSRVSPHGTRSCAIDGSKSTSPPQSSSAPPSLPGASVADIDFNRMKSHPEGAKLIDRMINLSLQLESEHPPQLADRRSIAKSLSSPDNTSYYGPLTKQEKQAFIDDCKDEYSFGGGRQPFSDAMSMSLSKCTPMNIPSSSSSASSTPRFYASPTSVPPQPLMAQRPDRRCGMLPTKMPYNSIHSLPPAPHNPTTSFYPSGYHSSWPQPNHPSMAQAQAHRHHSAYTTPALYPHYSSTVLNSQNMPPVN